MHTRRPNNEWDGKHILKFHNAVTFRSEGTYAALPDPHHMINVNINIPSKTVNH